ncbi:MAG: hypothetical protein QG639_487, partial [Patescibacteria group bacterium]|nr:hypothetical protein [Patescibacteria group bacterium]
LKSNGFHRVAQAIENMRTGKIKIMPGYDGVYGTVDALSEYPSSETEQLTLGI